jgi:NAD(P)-dependent dehydrogenase (short-subunit alcohol dehydrogenase family)
VIRPLPSAVAEVAKRLGKLDVLVASAGISIDALSCD